MEIRPIRTERDLDRAFARLDRVWGARKGTAAADEADVLIPLIMAYEEEHHPIPPPGPIDAIRFLMEQEGLTRRDLEKAIGSRARVSEVLNGQRPLTLPMIRRLRDAFGISADILIGPGEPERAGSLRARLAGAPRKPSHGPRRTTAPLVELRPRPA